ncbi:MAG: metallophosphoesterase [Candidatus Edwardsbacteria bacterium]|nr:metallophosphoesterase [Candidatus Edwardsbacteria bacterium]
MKIGLISDTHDNLEACQKACEAFFDEDVKIVLHAGDFVAPFIVPVFAKARLKLIAVYGNNDGEKIYLKERFEEAGFELHSGPYELKIGDRSICMMHEPRCLESLIKAGTYDLILYGHTHKVDIFEEGTLVVNPGEACGYLTGKPTCAVVELDDMSGRIIEL